MAIPNFTELLHTLKEVHEQEVEGWQEKVMELTNKRNRDAKRLEELYNRNQQLREQQKMQTDNIKQLENMLRAGLCDRCTVSQEMAKKQQHEYESAQLQSLQHISVLMSEISVLMKENEKLKEEVKSLHGRIEKQNGYTEETRSLEIKHSPDPGIPLTPVTSVLKREQLSVGGTTASVPTVKSESETTETERKEPSDKGHVHKRLQGWSGSYPFEPSKLTTLMSVGSPTSWKERRSVSMDSFETRPSPPSPTLPSHLHLLKKNLFLSKERPQRVSVPLRPHPIKTTPSSLHWPLPERKDWAVMATVSSGAYPNVSKDSRSNLLHFAGLVSPTGGLEPRAQSQDSRQPICLPHRSPCEQAERRERGATVSVIAAPCWKASAPQGNSGERVFGENLREGEEEAPLDLSSAGGCKVNNTERTETAQSQPQSDMASSSSSSSTSSSSPPAPLSSPSSAQYASSPQSDPQTGDTKPQREEMWEKPKEMSVQEKEKKENGQFSENLKVPTLTISLRPVVVLESLKTAEQKEQSMGQSNSTHEQGEEKEEEGENKESPVRKISGIDNEEM